ncbi:MAG: hypothetical protein RIC12_00990 [Pirellulales bacterium]
MSWEKRDNQRYYYGWRKRSSGREKIYFGRGPIAELLARRDQLERAKKAATDAVRHEFVAGIESNNTQLQEVAALVKQLVSAEMIAAGYYRHDRGRWRKRR